jgi:ABC-type dipeptide/oligopeptide/nickel transport system ATPase component
MPSGVSAIMASRAGIGLIWDERGTAQDVQNIAAILQRLKQKAEEICH